MAISITVSDTNNDGKGINFASYFKSFAKTYEDASGRSGFNGEVSGTFGDTSNPMHADGYASTESMNGGKRSILFDGPSDFYYSALEKYQGIAHNIYGELSSISFGNKTKVTDLGDDDFSYSHKSDVLIEGFPEGYISTVRNKGELMGDLIGGNTKSLMAFLKSDSIEFTGSSGKDVFTSFNKADTLHGGAGNDRLNGGKGNDTIWGDEGNDVLTGSKGADTFVFEAGDGKDRITDFGKGADKIDFSGQFADFDAVMDAATAGKKGVTIAYDGGSVLLEGFKLANLTENHFVFDL